MRKNKIRLLSPWSDYIETEKVIFSADFDCSEADALLCEWAPSEELFDFPGPKAWYCCEPECQFNGIENGRWVELRSRLGENEFLFHNHKNPIYRVPHITHFQDIEVNKNQERLERVVVVVSNFGGGPRSRHPEVAYRNHFSTHASVDLFGRSSWQKYRKGLFSLPKAPKNYQGEIPGDWPAEEKRALLSRYKVCLCLENMVEPHYFTEKFLEAVVAGCIPVYRAHDSLLDNVLKGAKWVDPADYSDDPVKTIDTALSMDLDEYREANSQWLMSREVHMTHHSNIFSRIGRILLDNRKFLNP